MVQGLHHDHGCGRFTESCKGFIILQNFMSQRCQHTFNVRNVEGADTLPERICTTAVVFLQVLGYLPKKLSPYGAKECVCWIDSK